MLMGYWIIVLIPYTVTMIVACTPLLDEAFIWGTSHVKVKRGREICGHPHMLHRSVYQLTSLLRGLATWCFQIPHRKLTAFQIYLLQFFSYDNPFIILFIQLLSSPFNWGDIYLCHFKCVWVSHQLVF